MFVRVCELIVSRRHTCAHVLFSHGSVSGAASSQRNCARIVSIFLGGNRNLFVRVRSSRTVNVRQVNDYRLVVVGVMVVVVCIVCVCVCVVLIARTLYVLLV